jgi:hypothetical protein
LMSESWDSSPSWVFMLERTFMSLKISVRRN